MRTARYLLPIAIVALGVALGVALAGCAGREIGIAQKTYIHTVDHLNAEYDAGRISPETQVNVIAPARQAAKAVLDEMVAAYVEGRQFDWRASLRVFYEKLGPLLRQQQVLQETANGTN